MLIRILQQSKAKYSQYIRSLIFVYIRSIYAIEKYFISLSIKNLNVYA